MTYEELRPQIRNGDILLCKGKTFFGWLIKFATKTPYTHVAFIWRFHTLDRIMVLESKEGVGVRTVPLHFYLDYKGSVEIWRHDKYDDMLGVETCDSNGELNQEIHQKSLQEVRGKTKKMYEFAVDMFGHKYDWFEIAKIGFRIMGHYKRKAKRNKKYICSEYVEECFRILGIDIPYNSKGYITPGDYPKCEGIRHIGNIK